MPPSVMPFNSPHEPASGGKENSSGGPLPRGLLDPAINGESPLKSGHPRPIAAECCPCLPVCHSCHVHPLVGPHSHHLLHTGPHSHWFIIMGSLCAQHANASLSCCDPCPGFCTRAMSGSSEGHTHSSSRVLAVVRGLLTERSLWRLNHGAQRCHLWRPQRGHSSFGCSVNLPLGSRSADPHSTAVCCGNLLHSSPQPHTAGVVLHLPRWSTCYCNQDLRQETLKPGVTPAGTAISHVHSTCQCSACCCHSGSGL